MSTILTFQISGKSINELRKQYGTGKSGFYDQSWYKNEDFADSKPEAGKYTIDFGEDTRNKTFAEQQKGIAKDFEVAHPAVIAEAIFLHFKETGKRLCEDYWLRTSLVDSGGLRVFVGNFGADGLGVNGLWGDRVGGSLGVASSRKSKKKLDAGNLDPFESSSLELRVAELEKRQEKTEQRWNEIFKSQY